LSSIVVLWLRFPMMLFMAYMPAPGVQRIVNNKAVSEQLMVVGKTVHQGLPAARRSTQPVRETLPAPLRISGQASLREAPRGSEDLLSWDELSLTSLVLGDSLGLP
jgi:hypothetical protein